MARRRYSLFVSATGILLAGYQMSIGSLYTPNSLVRPILAFTGLGTIVAALIVLIISTVGITHWFLLVPALVILVVGVGVPIAWRIKNGLAGKGLDEAVTPWLPPE